MTEIKTSPHPIHGFPQLDPKPSAETLTAYYESRYVDPLRRAPRADGVVARIAKAAEQEAAVERHWREASEFADLAAHLQGLAPGRRALDVGAGIGELVLFLEAQGFEASGLEPSQEACRYAEERGARVERGDLAGHAARARRTGTAYDVITLLNVLEHVPDPEATLRSCHALLAPGGVLCVRVPNDFSAIQRAAARKLDRAPWWLASPDHVSYFSRDTLGSLLRAEGYEVLRETCDFPIDWFLLMGEDYLGEPAVGRRCHERRKAFELALEPAVRREIYMALARAGCGRNLIVFARRAP
jgi:2-polyprenyl-3-methyl-5-hydroxy-6-metoxy-1,4-benzoquinol methylase